MKRFVLVAACLGLVLQVLAAQDITTASTYRLDHTVVSYRGVSKEYAEAIARTVEAARAIAVEQFGFDMPETVVVNVEEGRYLRLFNDGRDHVFLKVRSEADVRQPSKSGVFSLYGMCHEVGHIAMYRLIPDHSWMTSGATEGWAHYLGSRLVDAVYAKEGEGLWPDRYDYRADGMERLKREVEIVRGVDIVRSAALWMELLGIVGDKGIAPIFKAWGQAPIDPADPGAALRRTLLATNPDKRLSDWWNSAEPVLVFKRPKSGFAARTVERTQLAGQPLALEQDDGKPAGKRSIAGSGHAVRFQVTGDTWYLSTVRIFGSRYGRPAPPKEDFHVWLCDADLKVIADFAFPYAKFIRGAPRWVALNVTPTNVPAKFIICVGFNPTATRGVYVHHDKEGSGNSLTGLPGGQARTFNQGDWLIRLDLDQAKSGDPLRRMK